MRGFHVLTAWVRFPIARLAVLAACGVGALLAGGAAAQAGSFSVDCPLPCVIDPGNHIGVDYVVPPDGHTYRWDISFASSDPAASVALGAPNQVEAFLLRSLGGGLTASEFSTDVDFLRNPISGGPGVASYLVRAPANFDNCTPATPAGVICAATYNVWGNGTQLSAFGAAPVTILAITESQVPEPATWAVLVLGMLGVGAALRRRRLQID